MRHLLVLAFLIIGQSFAVVDYWGIVPSEKKIEIKGAGSGGNGNVEDIPEEEEKEEIKGEERATHVETKNQKPKDLKKLSDEEILKESIKWYEEKIKKEKPPVEYLYFIDPERYSKVMMKWLTWMQEKNNSLIAPAKAFSNGKANQVNIKDAIKELRDRGYQIIYFYKEDCPYCQASKEIVDKLSRDFSVKRVDIAQNPVEAQVWRIRVTPTYIIGSPREKKIIRHEGYATYKSLISYFYNKIRGKQDDK